MKNDYDLPDGHEGFPGRKAGKPLADKRIVVPPSRPEINLLLDMLRERGAAALEFPRLVSSPPEDLLPIDISVRSLALFDWIVFSGRRCVRTFTERLLAAGHTMEALRNIRICALGLGAVLSLRDLGIAMDCIPRLHAPNEILRSLGDVLGQRFLLVRFEDASAELRQVLREGGASVAWVSGGRLGLEANARLAWRTFGHRPDAIALASPMAARYFARGLDLCGLNPVEAVKGVPVAAVGPATAAAAKKLGLKPTLVSDYHFVDVTEDHARASAFPL